MQQSEHKNRIIWLDELRGLTIVSMVFFHALWDIVYLYGHYIGWYRGTPGYVWQQSICMTFIVISGFSFHFDKHPIRRGVLISLLGIGITIVTALVEPSAIIIFGVLTFYGAAILLVTLFDRLLIKVPTIPGFIISVLLFLVTRDLPRGYLGYEGIRLVKLPDFLYRNIFTTFWGFMVDDFYSADYFPVVPWIFLFLTGYYMYGIWEKRTLNKFDLKQSTFLSTLGRHSLFIYILHQPILSLLFMLVF